MPDSHPLPAGRLQLLALSLMLVAGSVDAVGFLSLAHVYTANMSGNSVSLGMGLAGWKLGEMVVRVVPIGSFFAGLLLTAGLHEWFEHRHIRRGFAILFCVEAACIATYLVAGAILEPTPVTKPPMATFATLTAFAALSMGVQDASLRRAGALTVHTTHVTGVLLQLADAVVAAVMSLFMKAAPETPAGRGNQWYNAGFLLLLWCLYVGGAALGAITLPRLGPGTLVPACVLLLVWAVVDWRAPLTPPDKV